MSMKEAGDKSGFSAISSVMARLPFPLLAFDSSGKWLAANPAALSLMGYTGEEVFGMAPQVIFESLTPTEFSKAVQSLLRDPEQPVTISASLVPKKGSKLTCSLHLSVLQENQHPCILLAIGEEKQEKEVLKKANTLLEKEVAEKNLALSTILERITDGFTAFDKDWNYTYINKKAADTVFRDPAELIGKNVWQEFPEIVGTSLYHTYLQAMKEQVVIRKEEYVALFQKWFEGVAYPSPEGLSVFFQDITDKKNAELALSQKESLYRTIVETAQEGIWQIDAENKTSFVNTYLQTLLGYTKEEMIGKPFLSFMPAEAKQFALSLVEERKKGIAEQHEFTFLRKDGSLLPALVQSTPILQNGHYAGALAMVLDNTERKKAEVRLRESERRFRSLFEHSQDGVALLTEEGIILDVSPAIEKILGYIPTELVGTSCFDYILPEDRPAVFDAFAEVRKEPFKTKTAEYKAYAKNGTQKWLEGTYSNLLREPPVGAVVLNFRDVTERKKAENKLRESEAKYRRAQAQGRLGHWEWSAATNEVTWSDEIYAMFGLSPDTPAPDSEKFLNCIYAEDRTAVENKINEALANCEGYELFYRIVLKDGTLRHVHMLGEPVQNSDGELTKVVGMVQDVTAQKQVEEELSLSEQNYRLLFEKSPVPFWMVDYPTFNFIEVNQAATDLYGYTREEFLTMNVRDIRLDNPDAYFEQINASTKEGDTKKSITQHKKKNGEILFVQLAFSQIFYNGKMVRLASTRDITQEMLYEKQLQEKEHQLSLIFNNSVNGKALFGVEADGQFRFEAVNDALCNAIHIRREEVVGRTLLDVFGAKDVQHLLPGYREAVATGNVVQFTAQSSQRIGNRIVEYTAVPIRDGAGNVVQLLNISHDVTEKIKTEQDLLRINQELRQLSSHLENVREDERTNIAREIHDELGQQLTGLKMEISWIKRHLPQHDEALQTRIQASLNLIDNTINAVRKIASQLRPSLLDDLGLAEAMDWHRQEFSRHTGIQVSFFTNVEEVKFSPPVSIGLYRIFQEALTNVARHAKATVVACVLEKKGTRLFLTITDDGVGFILQPQRERNTLGLLGMKERVAVLNGHFTLESQPGKGTVISVDIPID